MERKLQERMLGAGVLILALVVVVPMILDGDSGDVAQVSIPGQRNDELRTHTFRLNETQPANPRAGETGLAADLPESGRQQVDPATALPTPPAGSAAAAVPVAKAMPELAGVPPAAPPSGAGAQATQATAATPRADTAGWLVQAGTFGLKDNADRLAAKLKQQGFAAFVSPAERSGRTLYRVRVGPPGSREAAAAVAARLAATGQTGQIVAR